MRLRTLVIARTGETPVSQATQPRHWRLAPASNLRTPDDIYIQNLSAIFTGPGFVARDGRRPTTNDCGFVVGRIDIGIDEASGNITSVAPDTRGTCDIIDGTDLIALPG